MRQKKKGLDGQENVPFVNGQRPFAFFYHKKLNEKKMSRGKSQPNEPDEKSLFNRQLYSAWPDCLREVNL